MAGKSSPNASDEVKVAPGVVRARAFIGFVPGTNRSIVFRVTTISAAWLFVFRALTEMDSDPAACLFSPVFLVPDAMGAGAAGERESGGGGAEADDMPGDEVGIPGFGAETAGNAAHGTRNGASRKQGFLPVRCFLPCMTPLPIRFRNVIKNTL
ncbi:hypothetical protein AA21291_0244 [Swaminathania salitolerans LMG 21291]|uniref:Uncharacterized protein n=1 Tax=Swaminathania salitolerans TaxID=182838 RepID=A0A511BLY4_9PROT|nr:hypothetical protein AA21291_0244 [Swaminathania salitolerans LMG 21291]GEL01102.1 hypothetical protein SSA02_02650 [Swaminathania salitolerans]